MTRKNYIDDKKIKLDLNVGIIIKILAAIVISYSFFEKNYLNVSVFLLILIKITQNLKNKRNNNKLNKNQRIVERVSDIFVFLGVGFSGITPLFLGTINFIMVVFIGYIPFFWAKRAHQTRYIIILLSIMGRQINIPHIIDFALIICILITGGYLFKNIKNANYIFK